MSKIKEPPIAKIFTLVLDQDIDLVSYTLNLKIQAEIRDREKEIKELMQQLPEMKAQAERFKVQYDGAVRRLEGLERRLASWRLAAISAKVTPPEN